MIRSILLILLALVLVAVPTSSARSNRRNQWTSTAT